VSSTTSRGFASPGNVVHEALAGAAQVPDLVAVVAPEHGEGVTEPGRAQLRSIVRSVPRWPTAFLGMAYLDHEHGAGIALDEEAVLGVLEVGLGALEDVPVDQLATKGPVAHRDERGVERVLDRLEMRAEQRSRRRQRLDVELVLHAEEERALGAGEQPAEVERLGRRRVEDRAVHQLVERVAGVAARDGGLGVISRMSWPVLRIAQQVTHGAVDLRLQRVGAGAFLELLLA
jgi:hypothetical protein